MNLHEYKINNFEKALKIIKDLANRQNKFRKVKIEDYATRMINDYLSRLQEDEYYTHLNIIIQILETDNNLLIVRLYPSKDDISSNELGVSIRCGELISIIESIKEEYQ